MRASPTVSCAPMPPKLTTGQRLRLRARQTLGVALKAVPLSAIEHARRRRILVPLLRHRSIAGLGSFTIPSTPPIKLVAVDSRLTRMLYWYGSEGYEDNEVFWWKKLCQEASGILEVGANIGYYTVQGALSAPETPYTAVEAHPATVEILKRNLALNDIAHVRVVQAAVVGRPESDHLELSLPDFEQYAAPTGAFLSSGTEGVAARRAAGRSVSVPAVASASLIDGVDLVKLDIEGAEYEVLNGILTTLIERRALLLVEVLRDTPKLRSLLLELDRHAYGFWLVSGPTLRRVPAQAIESDNIAAVYGSRDLAVIPEERRAAIDT